MDIAFYFPGAPSPALSADFEAMRASSNEAEQSPVTKGCYSKAHGPPDGQKGA